MAPLSELIKSSIQSLNLQAVNSAQLTTPSGALISVDSARLALERFQEWYLVCSTSLFLHVRDADDELQEYVTHGGPGGSPVVVEPHLLTSVGRVSDVVRSVAGPGSCDL
jgi:hypothetical protein